MPSFAVHRTMTAKDLSPFVVTKGNKRYTIYYVSTSKKDAERMAKMWHLIYGYGYLIRNVTVKARLGESTAHGVFIRKGGKP